MAAVALGYKMLLTIMGLVLYAWVIGGVIGIELFAGALSSVCLLEDEGIDLELEFVEKGCARTIDCPPPQTCFLRKADSSRPEIAINQFRPDHSDKIGFDTIGSAFMTEFQITVMDDWPELAQPIIDSSVTTTQLVWPLFMVIVITVSLLSVNLFLASMTFSFLTIRQENRGDQATLALFQECDKDEDGLLNRKEVRDLAERLGHDLSEEELDAAMAEVRSIQFTVWFRPKPEVFADGR